VIDPENDKGTIDRTHEADFNRNTFLSLSLNLPLLPSWTLRRTTLHPWTVLEGR